MLLVHPSSQCDVCLDPYTWVTPAKSPHAIQCGHVFCYKCVSCSSYLVRHIVVWRRRAV